MYFKLIPLFVLSLVKTSIFAKSVENGTNQQHQIENRPDEFENKLTINNHLLKAINLQIQKNFAEKIDSRDQVQQNQNPSRNCLEIKNKGNNVSAVYTIQPQLNSTPFNIWCDMKTNGGGWTYILNRYDGSQNFDLNWTDYRNGFGSLTSEHWLGLEHLHQLTADNVNELLIEMEDWYQPKVTVRYTSFSIGNETEGYQIKVIKGFHGDVYEDFSWQTGIKFSTKDNDQDPNYYENCAVQRIGGWWYSRWCSEAKFTGLYGKGKFQRGTGIFWLGVNSEYGSLKKVKMMIKPNNL